jgi:hypothetical protein
MMLLVVEKMNNLSKEQKKLIYDAVRYYQMNAVPLNSKNYQICDSILNELFLEVKSAYVEPAYEQGN